MQPIDSAWNVAKGEVFHPSVAGYMAAGQGGERDQAFLQVIRHLGEIYDNQPLEREDAQRVMGMIRELHSQLSSDPTGEENMRTARPRVESANRPRVQRYTNRYGNDTTFLNRPSTNNMPPRTMRSGDYDALRMRMYNEGQGEPVGPTGELDTLAHVNDEPIGFDRTDTQIISDEHDEKQGARRLNWLGQLLQRSSDSPIDSAWNLLKALSREDLEMASRTGGMARMPGTMRPEFSSGHPGHMAPMIGEMNQPPAYHEGSEMMQEYNELINPEEEAEHHRINAPTPARSLGMHGMHGINYDDGRMRLTNEIPIDEAGDASMDDPSQMEHLGRELADAHHEDIDPLSDMTMGSRPPNFRTLQARAPNRHAYMQRR